MLNDNYSWLAEYFCLTNLKPFAKKDFEIQWEIKQRLWKYRMKLLVDVKNCIASEIKHVNNYMIKFGKEKRIINSFAIIEPMEKRCSKKDILKCWNLFKQKRWMPQYGGPAWANICRLWMRLYHVKASNVNECMVRMDNLIDSCHNTNNTLDKIYPNIKTWLNIKTFIISPYWIINQCKTGLMKVTKKKFKQYLNMHERDFNTPTSNFNCLLKSIKDDYYFRCGIFKQSLFYQQYCQHRQGQSRESRDRYLKQCRSAQGVI